MVSFSARDVANLDGDQVCFIFFYLLECVTAGMAITFGARLLYQNSSACVGFRFLGINLILIGVALVFLWYVTCLLSRHQELVLIKSACCTLPLLVALAAWGIFALVVSSKGGGKSLPGRSYKEYHVESYSKFMVRRVNDTHNWDHYYKKAVVKGHVCSKFFKEYQLDTLDEFHTRSLDPFESGCCKPPEDCNFNYTSPAEWVKPNNANYTNNDCNRWDNDRKTLCFDCHSCKAGFLQDLKSRWFETGLFLVLVAAKQIICGICIAYSVCHDLD